LRWQLSLTKTIEITMALNPENRDIQIVLLDTAQSIQNLRKPFDSKYDAKVDGFNEAIEQVLIIIDREILTL